MAWNIFWLAEWNRHSQACSPPEEGFQLAGKSAQKRSCLWRGWKGSGGVGALTDGEVQGRCHQVSFKPIIHKIPYYQCTVPNFFGGIHKPTKMVVNFVHKLISSTPAIFPYWHLLTLSWNPHFLLKDSLASRSSPALWLPLTSHSPRLFFERKRLSKSMEHLAQQLSQV